MTTSLKLQHLKGGTNVILDLERYTAKANNRVEKDLFYQHLNEGPTTNFTLISSAKV